MSEPQITKEIPDFQQPPDVGVLRNGAFLRLWIAQLLTQIGGNVVLYGLTVLVAERSGSTSALSLLFLSFLVPAVALSPISGVWVDRLDKRLVLIVANFAVFLLYWYGLGTDVSIARFFMVWGLVPFYERAKTPRRCWRRSRA